MVLQGIYSVLPLLLLTALGFFAVQLPWFGRDGMGFLSKYNIDLAIPVYLFYNVVRAYSSPNDLVDLAVNLKYPFILVFSSIAIGYLMAVPLRLRPPQRGVFINAISLSNTVVMGMPVVAQLFGESVLPTSMVFYASNTIIYWTVGVWILRREVQGGGLNLGQAVVKLLVSKPLMGYLLGILWVAIDLPRPEVLLRTMGMVSASVTPLAMMFIGCVIRLADFRSISTFRELSITAGYKMLITPLVSGVILSLFPVDLVTKQVLFILSVMPAMTQLPMVAKEVGSDYEMASMTTACTTAISMAAVPVYLFIMTAYQFPR